MDAEVEAGVWAPSGAPAPRRPGSRARIILTVVAVVMVLVAGAGVFFLGRQTSIRTAGGQSSPQLAVSALVTALSSQDPGEIADRLDPVEAGLFADGSGQVLTQLKRLGIVDPSATSASLLGSHLTVSGLTYGPVDEINDRLSAVSLTGGTVTVTRNPAALPLTPAIRTALGTDLSRSQQQTTRTVNLADEVKRLGHPIRVLTVLVGGQWYPSLGYSAIDFWAQSRKLGDPTAADAIHPAGAGSAQDAMNSLLSAISRKDLAAIISLLPPDEMGAVQDYGRLIVQQAQPKVDATPPVKFSDATWNVSPVTGGTLVSLKTVTVTFGGRSVSISVDKSGQSLSVALPGLPAFRVTGQNLGAVLAMLGHGAPGWVKDLAGKDFDQLLNLGAVTTEVGGRWYVSPLRTFSNLGADLLKGLAPSDIGQLLTLAHK